MKLTEKCFKRMAGAYAAMFTPIGKNNKVNEEVIEQEIEYGLENGLAGFYLTGSTGGWFLLSPEERKIVWKRAVKTVKERCKLIAHVGDASTDVSVELAKAAAKWQDEANQVVKLMIESDNWSYRKAMMKLVGIDVGPYREPFEKLTSAQARTFLKRVAALNVVKKVSV